MTPSHLHHPMIEMIDELIRLTSRLRSVFPDSSQVTGLNAMQNAVLTAVAEAAHPPTVPQIGRSIGHPRQVIQRAANVLLADELIETISNPDHKRAPLLIITAKGKKLKTLMDRRAIKAADELLKLLDIEQCQRLTHEMHELRGEVEAFVRKKTKK